MAHNRPNTSSLLPSKVQSSEYKKLQLMWRLLTHIKAEGFRKVGAEEGIWNTEQEPKQTCITMSLKIFTLRQQYSEDDQTREGGMDGSMPLAMMARSVNTVSVVKPQRTGPTARPMRRVEQIINTDITQIAREGAEVMCVSED